MRWKRPSSAAKWPLQLQISVRSASKSTFYVDAQVSHGVLDLGVTEQDLDGSEVAGRLVDHRCLRASQWMGTILRSPQADRVNPFVNQSRVLPRAQVSRAIHAAWKCMVRDRSTSQAS